MNERRKHIMLDRKTLDISDPWVREKTCNPELCSNCGGRCCKTCGCSYFPEQLPMKNEELMTKKGITISSMAFDSHARKLPKPILYVRASNIGEGLRETKPVGTCKFLTDKGCSLSYEERPLGGTLIVPFQGLGGCYALYSDEEFIELWLPYQQLLQEIVDEIGDR